MRLFFLVPSTRLGLFFCGNDLRNGDVFYGDVFWGGILIISCNGNLNER